MSKIRQVVAVLALSASAFVGIANYESYREEAYLPTPNDVPTIGYGHTEGVKLGDRTTPERALRLLSEETLVIERKLRECIGDVPLYSSEWDAYVSLAYNIGTGAFCSSTLVKLLKEKPPKYEEACKQILRWDKQKGKVLKGLTRRRESEYKLCMGELQ